MISASYVDMTPLVKRRDCLKRFRATDCTPLMEEWERVLADDNRRRALAGLDCNDQPMMPTQRERRGAVLGQKAATLGAQLARARERSQVAKRDTKLAKSQAKRTAQYLDVDIAAENRRLAKAERVLGRVMGSWSDRSSQVGGLAAGIRERRQQLAKAERSVRAAMGKGDAKGSVRATATRRDLEQRLARLERKLAAAQKSIGHAQTRGDKLAKMIQTSSKLSHLATSARLDRGVYAETLRTYRAATKRQNSIGRALSRVSRMGRGLGSGPPLAPNNERSRIIRFARSRHGQLKASEAWFAELGWRSFTDKKGRGILGHHQRGIPSNMGPIRRDVLSRVSPTAFAECRSAAQAFWLVQLRLLGGG
jgi:hypothetical protein